MKSILINIIFIIKIYITKLILIVLSVSFFNFFLPSFFEDFIGEVYAEEPNKPPKMSWWESIKNWINENGDYILGGIAVIAAIAIAKKVGIIGDTDTMLPIQTTESINALGLEIINYAKGRDITHFHHQHKADLDILINKYPSILVSQQEFVVLGMTLFPEGLMFGFLRLYEAHIHTLPYITNLK